jgi:hypothetical protein
VRYFNAQNQRYRPVIHPVCTATKSNMAPKPQKAQLYKPP